MQENLKALQSELGKGKSSAKAQAALDELHYLTSFNQNVSFSNGQITSTLVGRYLCPDGAETHIWRISSQELNMTLSQPCETVPLMAILCSRTLSSGKPKMSSHNLKLISILPSPAGRGMFAGGYKKKQQNRFQPYPSSWKQSQDTSCSSGQAGKDMPVWK